MNYRIVIATLQLCQTKFKTFEPLIKLIMRIFTSMDNLAKHFLVRIKKVKTAMDSAKFDSLVKHVAKELTPKVYDLITFINDVSDAWQFQIKIIIIVFLLKSVHFKNTVMQLSLSLWTVHSRILKYFTTIMSSH